MSNSITLPSGKTLYANFGIIGINADFHLGHGCDGDLEGADLRAVVDETHFEPEEYNHLSDNDKIALADRMITLWQTYKTKVKIEGGRPDTKINARQADVLLRLDEDEQSERYSSLNNIAIDLAWHKNDVRLVARALARKGLAKRVPWHDDEGYIRGSGYAITPAGQDLAAKLRPSGQLIQEQST